jgi:lipopolysaccharide export system permease protein
MLNDYQRYIRKHEIELYRKFTLAFACLIFFFIGAPLGAITRKGGLGAPVVISVVMFIIYYIIDNTGYKMAREALWPCWAGMWLSSFVLLPIGIFLTIKAASDSALFNPEAWMKIYGKIAQWVVMKLKYFRHS